VRDLAGQEDDPAGLKLVALVTDPDGHAPIQQQERLVVDADAAELWRNHQRRWLNGARRLAGWLDQEGRLAEPFTPASAADMIWSLMSVDLLDRLLNQRGWSAKRTGEHLAVLFTSTFAADERPAGSAVEEPAGSAILPP
jgi:hypothetical protein